MKKLIVLLFGVCLLSAAMATDERGEGTSIGLTIENNTTAVIRGDSAQVIYDALNVPEQTVGGGDTSSELHKNGKGISCAHSLSGYRCGFAVSSDGVTRGNL